MSVSGCAGLLELLFALLRRLVVPVTSVHIVGDDGVVHLLHDGQELATGLKIRWAHVLWLLAEDVDEGLLDFLHLALDLSGTHAPHMRVRPKRV